MCQDLLFNSEVHINSRAWGITTWREWREGRVLDTGVLVDSGGVWGVAQGDGKCLMGQRSLGPRQRGHRVWAPGTRAYGGDHGHPASSSKTYETNCPSGNPSMVSSDWEGQVTLHWRPAWGSKALALGIWDGKASLWDTGMGRENLMAPTGSLVSDLNFAMFVYVPGGPGL